MIQTLLANVKENVTVAAEAENEKAKSKTDYQKEDLNKRIHLQNLRGLATVPQRRNGIKRAGYLHCRQLRTDA